MNLVLQRLKKVTLFIWLAVTGAVYLSYYPVKDIIKGLPHLSFAAIPLHFAVSLSLLLVIILAATGLGLIFWRNTRVSEAEKLILSVGTGLGIISLMVLLSDLLGFAGKIFFTSLILSGLAASSIWMPDLRKSLKAEFAVPLLLSLPALASALM